jgi:hypothetical protein
MMEPRSRVSAAFGDLWKGRVNATIELEIEGLGIVAYSPFAVSQIAAGEDYFEAHLWQPADVAERVNSCQMAAFCTGSPGRYLLRVYDGPMDEQALQAATVKARLGVEVREQRLCFRDLYDFMTWDPECPPEQTLSVANGFHRITAYTAPPSSGIIGDGQTIWLHLEAWPERPQLLWKGVPDLVAEPGRHE